MNFAEIIALHRERYPLMQGRDWVKLCYQSEFGAGHMIADSTACLARLKTEYENTPAADGPLFEAIGGGLCRLHLGPLHHENVPLKIVSRLFELAAVPRGNREGLEGKLAMVETPEYEAYLAEYRKNGCPAVSHSEIYRQAYHPAYRVVPDWAERYWKLITAIAKLTAEKERVIIAIDGMSGSGKSTLGAYLQQLFSGDLIHMDDFFLPFKQKTPQRLSQPGGNVDHERFRDEVIEPLKRGEPFSYRPYSCQHGCLGEVIAVQPGKLTIIEGCYCHHPALEAAYDLRVFLKLTPQEQSSRILARNGESMHKRFIEQWIPMENAYFEAFRIEDQSHLVFK